MRMSMRFSSSYSTEEKVLATTRRWMPCSLRKQLMRLDLVRYRQWGSGSLSRAVRSRVCVCGYGWMGIFWVLSVSMTITKVLMSDGLWSGRRKAKVVRREEMMVVNEMEIKYFDTWLDILQYVLAHSGTARPKQWWLQAQLLCAVIAKQASCVV